MRKILKLMTLLMASTFLLCACDGTIQQAMAPNEPDVTATVTATPRSEVIAFAPPTPEPTAVPTPTPVPTPVPTPTPEPTAEPTGMALKLWQLEQAERAYFAENPPDKDIEEVMASLKIDPNKPMIAITFDDGPSKRATPRILDVLEQYNCRATFFVVGERIADHEDIIQRAIGLNCEIGSHTYYHGKFTGRKASALTRDLQNVENEIFTRFGYKMRLYRPTYGSINDNVREGAKDAGYPMILWTGSAHDWSYRDTGKIYKAVMASIEDGGIILFHDLYTETAAAIERIVPELIEQGYQLVTVSELMFFSEHYPLQAGQKYKGNTKE